MPKVNVIGLAPKRLNLKTHSLARFADCHIVFKCFLILFYARSITGLVVSQKKTVLLGFRNLDFIVFEDRLSRVGDQVSPYW